MLKGLILSVCSLFAANKDQLGYQLKIEDYSYINQLNNDQRYASMLAACRDGDVRVLDTLLWFSEEPIKTDQACALYEMVGEHGSENVKSSLNVVLKKHNVQNQETVLQ